MALLDRKVNSEEGQGFEQARVGERPGVHSIEPHFSRQLRSVWISPQSPSVLPDGEKRKKRT